MPDLQFELSSLDNVQVIGWLVLLKEVVSPLRFDVRETVSYRTKLLVCQHFHEWN